MTYAFFAMLSRMKYINRWGLMRNTRGENISEHSLETAMIAHCLALIGNRRLSKRYDENRATVLAIFHDAPEIITGDLPTPVKYHSQSIREAYGEVENIAVNRLLSMLPEDLREDYSEILNESKAGDESLKPLVKAADKISALIKCIEEKKSGNTEFLQAEKSLRRQIGELSVEEAQVFIDELLPAYTLTLDELN